MTPEPWDDERLAAAFTDRYDRPAPRELTIATVERVRVTRRRSRWWPTVDRPIALGLASVVAVTAVLVVLVMPRTDAGPGVSTPPSEGSSPIASSAQNTPYQSFPPSPAVAGFAATAAGLRVRAVTDGPTVLADPDLGDTELAFAGWYSASDLAPPCPFELTPASPIEIRCGDVRAWLSATDRPILSATGSFDQPANPAGMIALRFVPPVDPLGGQGGPRHAMNTTPQPVVIVGHFYDERAVRCPPDARSTCERTLVVDGVASASGELRDTGQSQARGSPATRLGAEQAAVLARAWVGSAGEILSVGLVRGSDAPWFDDASRPECACRLTWFVRGYRILPTGTSDRRGAGTPVAGWLTIDDQSGTFGGTMDQGGESLAPHPAGFPATVEGLRVRAVADAIEAAGRLPLEAGAPFAVAGWLTQTPIHPCPTPSSFETCERDTVVLDGTPERLITFDSNGFAATFPAKGPILYPAILEGGPALPARNGDGSPRRVVLLMHRGDQRSDSKGPADPVAATDWVLDQVAWLDGVDQPPSVWIEAGIAPTRGLDDVLSIAGPIQFGRTWTISISAVDATHLRAIGSSPSTDVKGVVWLIRMVGSNPLDPNSGPNGWGTVLVDDATGEFHAQWSEAGS